ncbi:phosphatidylserine decarboxylase-domain-containing protein [Circinella umbellata]|nr:phosphatidylserine decarboxylase-domain-containing protein [Circinella umbellata]
MSRPHSRTGSFDNEVSDDIEHSPSPSSSSSTDSNELVLQVSILRARHLYAKLEDNNNLNPYVIISCAGQRQRTHVVKKSEDPDWQCTVDIKLPRTRRKRRLFWTHGIVATVCSKDRFKSVFLGQVRFPIESLFSDYVDQQTKWYPIQEPLRSKFRIRRRKNNAAEEQGMGELEIKFGLTHTSGAEGVDDDELREMWNAYVEHYHPTQEIESLSSLPSDMGQLQISTQQTSSRRQRIKSGNSSTSQSSNNKRNKKSSGRVKKKFKRRKDYIAKFYSDVVGVVFLEISHANDLPPERNMTRTGFDMDPFVIVSYGTSTFRTRAIRHNLNPVWNEKLFFHVRENESKYKLKFSVYDKDKITGNDFVAWKELDLGDIIHYSQKNTTTTSPTTNDTPADAIDAQMNMHTVDLEMINKERWQDRHPTLTFRAKFVPYTEMRKLFWVALAKNYGDEGMIGRLGVLSMLESLGSTISESTVNGFWEQHEKDPETDELTLDELVESLENFMLSSEMPFTRDHIAGGGIGNTDTSDSSGGLSDSDMMDEEDEEDDDEDIEVDELVDLDLTDDYDDRVETPSSTVSEEAFGDDVLLDAQGIQYGGDQSDMALDMSRSSSGNGNGEQQEQVIRLAECPICHRPNLSRRAQMDIVTHVAMCAANDWTTVDRFLMGDFVTEAYAQRRWFVKLVSKVGYGKYQVGRNNANIIVQDRRTGQLIEERMSVYVRLGMRLIYKGMKTGIQSKTAQRVLTNMTFKQGRRYDSLHSVREIQPFIKFHNLDMSEILDPIDSFKTFNEFFYRKLKPEARPCEYPDDPSVIVSPADCRMMAFATIDDATRLWIKGMEFSVEKLLDDPVQAEAFQGGSLAIFRLAPQDYHRFHSPVDGTITDIKYISGQYYTVNPMAIRTTLDVYGENARSVVSMETEAFGKVAVVLIGAMMVGSIVLTPHAGDYLARTDELGYFAFGGSTIVVLWEKGAVTFDRDLLENSEKTLETLVRKKHKSRFFVVVIHSFYVTKCYI